MAGLFSAYCSRQGWTGPFFPAKPAQVLNWLAAEATRLGQAGPMSQNALRSYASALAARHVDLGLDPSACSGTLVNRLCLGAARTVGIREPSRALPITLPLLRKILGVLRDKPRDFGGPDAACAIRAACAVAFACFLRPGEFTYDVFDSATHFSWDCLDFGDTEHPATLRLKKSKSDRLSLGVTIAVPVGPPDVCPLRHLREWHQRSLDTRPSSPVFVLPGGGFPKKIVVAAVRRALTQAHVLATGYSGHSFRRGAATWAKSIGMSDDDIRLLGRWSSAAVLRYTDRPASAIAALSSRCLVASSSTLPASGVPGAHDIWQPRS